MQMCFQSPWLIFLCMFVCMYACMHACMHLCVVWTERKREIDIQLWLIPTDSNKLTNAAWPCVIDVWITVFCLYGNYKI
jgi:hypothetical protein